MMAPAPAAALDATWYGWQTLIADALDAGVWLLLIQTVQDGGGGGSMALGVLGVVGYLVPAPVIHGMHGQGGIAGLSIGTRLLAPTLFGVIGAAMVTCQSSAAFGCLEAPLAGAFVGVVIGAGVAAFLDGALFAWKPRDEPAPPLLTSHTPTLRWLPTAGVVYDASHRAAPTLGVTGSF
jgi:hypothetical protein